MSDLENKIEAHDRSITEVLKEKKYTVDYFQREYNWGEQHINQLISDLTSAFLNEYTEGDERKKTASYNSYYLGPFVVSNANDSRSIIDGQQRLTSITLFLIFLNHLQKEQGLNNKIEELIFSEAYGELSFNINVEERTKCLKSLFETNVYNIQEGDNESIINMTNRYMDISNSFPEEINGQSLSMFIDWLTRKVVLVEIIAYKDENAYTIFETMNDRGLNLTPTEMLKSYLLSKYEDKTEREKINKIWKSCIQELHEYNKDEDQRFIQSWLRAKHADTIRESKKDALNEDFEKIGTRFHSWVREKADMLNLKTNSDFVNFVEKDFKFYFIAYLKLLEATRNLTKETENIYYLDDYGIATSLSYPLMLSPLMLTDSLELQKNKMNIVAKYLEIFVVRRSINHKRFASSSIRYTMYTLVKEIRNKTIEELRDILNKKLEAMPEKWSGMSKFEMNGQNKGFVKFLLSRISGYVDTQSGQHSNYDSYFRPTGKPFEIEHIWADKYERHSDEFPQKADFVNFRNRIGDLVLLPRGTNQSYNAIEYRDKLQHYVKENLLVRSLTNLAYEKNPNFNNFIKESGLQFVPHPDFKKADIEKRQLLYQAICENIWETL